MSIQINKPLFLMPCTADSHSDVVINEDFVTSEGRILNIKISLRLSVKIHQENAKQGNYYSILFS